MLACQQRAPTVALGFCSMDKQTRPRHPTAASLANDASPVTGRRVLQLFSPGLLGTVLIAVCTHTREEFLSVHLQDQTAGCWAARKHG